MLLADDLLALGLVTDGKGVLGVLLGAPRLVELPPVLLLRLFRGLFVPLEVDPEELGLGGC